MNSIPSSPNDPVNTDILMVAEDRVKGFRRFPFHAISEQCGHPVPVVIQRLKAMMEAGVVRRVRQTLRYQARPGGPWWHGPCRRRTWMRPLTG